MKVKYKSLFEERIFEAKMGKSASLFSRNEFLDVLEIDAYGSPVQLESPGFDLVIIEANHEELKALRDAGYQFVVQS